MSTNSPVVTFLIPCYNVSHCVEHCLQSILTSSVSNKVEVLTINDGSKDNTSAILHSYESRYPGIVRVIDKTNGGWGTAINLGVVEARGKYLKEVDADDWVETEQLEAYVTALESMEVDYVATDYKEFWAKEDKYILHSFQKEIYNKIQTPYDFWENHPTAWDFPIHAITYRTQFLKEIKLTVGDRYYGDIEYNLYPATQIKSITALPCCITVYFRGSDEQSTSTAGYAKHYKDYVALSQRLISYQDKVPQLHPRFAQFVKETICGTAARAYHLMMSPVYAADQPDAKQDLKTYDAWLKVNNKKIYDYCGRIKRKGVRNIWIWRRTGINLAKLVFKNRVLQTR